MGPDITDDRVAAIERCLQVMKEAGVPDSARREFERVATTTCDEELARMIAGWLGIE